MQEDRWKDIVLFGYSAWGMIAHRIWEKNWCKSVSFWMSPEPNKTMVWTLLSLTNSTGFKEFGIPETGTNIIETFSAMVPHTWDIEERTVQLENVYSHALIGRNDVIEKIAEQILLWFKKEL